MLGMFKEQKSDEEIKEMIASKDINKDGNIELNEMEEDMKQPSTSYIKRIYDDS